MNMRDYFVFDVAITRELHGQQPITLWVIRACFVGGCCGGPLFVCRRGSVRGFCAWQWSLYGFVVQRGFCGRERFWAGEKQRRRKRGTLISFVVRRRFGDEGFFAPRKRREEKKRKDFHVHTFGFPFSVGLVGRFSWKAFRQPKRTKETRRTRAEQDTNNKEDEE